MCRRDLLLTYEVAKKVAIESLISMASNCETIIAIKN